MILGQLRMGARQAKNAPLGTSCMNGIFNNNLGEMVMTAMTETTIVVMMVRGGYKLFGRQLPTMIYYSHTPGGGGAPLGVVRSY